MHFNVEKLVAWAPGLETEADWARWSQAPELQRPEERPACEAVPAMMRRRLTLWGRMALDVACRCQAEPESSELLPTLFASRHGDTHRNAALLENLARGEALSPTDFSFSVHNSSSGVFSMVAQTLGPAIALAAGRDTLGQALVEAYTWLAQGEQALLLVYCDQPLADFYQPDSDESDMPVAFAMRLRAAASGSRFSLDFDAVNSSPAAQAPSFALQFLQFWYGAVPAMEYSGVKRWRVQRL